MSRFLWFTVYAPALYITRTRSNFKIKAKNEGSKFVPGHARIREAKPKNILVVLYSLSPPSTLCAIISTLSLFSSNQPTGNDSCSSCNDEQSQECSLQLHHVAVVFTTHKHTHAHTHMSECQQLHIRVQRPVGRPYHSRIMAVFTYVTSTA